MALDLTASRYNQFGSEMKTLHSSVLSIEEGSLLVAVLENGEQTVKPSAGTSGEIPAGFALNSPVNVKEVPFFELITVPASGPYTATLAFTPKPGTVTGAFVPTAGAVTIGAGAPGAGGAVQVVGKAVTFHSADAGKVVRISYRRELTVTESNNLFGSRWNDGAQSSIGATGAIMKAEFLFTTMYDPTSDWFVDVPGPLYTGAGGLISLNTAGSLVRNCSVYKAPTPTFPFLGVRVNI